MPRRKRRAPRQPPDPPLQPFPDPPLTDPPPEVESLDDLIERAATIKRTSNALIRQMNELASQIQEVKARRKDRGGTY